MNSHIFNPNMDLVLYKKIKTVNSKYLQEKIHFIIEDKNVDVCMQKSRTQIKYNESLPTNWHIMLRFRIA